MIVAMIENPAGVEIVDRIAAVPGIDVVFAPAPISAASPGSRQGDSRYEALVTRIVETTTKAGVKLGGPLAWKKSRKGYAFFQGPGETTLIRCGTRVALDLLPTGCPTMGVAPIEGRER